MPETGPLRRNPSRRDLEQLSVKIPAALKQRLEEEALRRRWKVSPLVVAILEHRYGQAPPPPPPPPLTLDAAES